jgi:hypothetical protein
MRRWNIGIDDPGVFTIAADLRCGPTNYYNDHIWEFTLGGGEPSAIAIQTTFGFRARTLKLFPRFVEADDAIIDPTNFSTQPIITNFYPNYLQVEFSPFTGIDVICEYWVPESNILKGRICVTNSRLGQRQLKVQLAALLYPVDGGQRMAADEIDSVAILAGITSELNPVVFMTGGPGTSVGPYPALTIELDLAPGGNRVIDWAHAALNDKEKSFHYARDWTSKSWESGIAKLEILNQRNLEIQTGDPDWNAAFAFGRNQAYSLLVGPTEHLSNPSNVYSRLPDHGFSSLGNGTDYDHLWDGQTPLDIAYLCSFLLPETPHLAIGLLNNFLETQTQGGFVDFKPGLGGQRSHIMATPILTHLAWQIYELTDDTSFLVDVFPKLLRFVQAWFNEKQDRDGDGLPEWTRTSQSGFEDHPIFSQWESWSQGGDISKVESPSLCAFLFNEIQLLIEIAKVTKHSSPLSSLKALADNLKSAVDTSWDSSESIFHNWDRESHISPSSDLIGVCEGSGEIQINRHFSKPVRLSLRLDFGEEIPHNIRIFIHGTGLTGNHRIERIEADKFRWSVNRGNVSSDQVYTTLEYIEIHGLGLIDKVTIDVINLSANDHTLLLPLWAGMLDSNKASILIRNTILNEDKFWKPFGIPACPHETSNDGDGYPYGTVHMIWNNLIGLGLLKYGFQKEAAELITRLMNAIILNLKTNKSFYNNYFSDSGRGIGERNGLGGLPPQDLFLKTLGVKIINPTKVLINGTNPFPWPVSIRYQGLWIYRDKKKTKIIFPGGQSAIVKSPEPREVSLEKST